MTAATLAIPRRTSVFPRRPSGGASRARAVVFTGAAVPLVLLCLLWCVLPKPPLLDGVSFSRQLLDRRGQLLRITLSGDGKYRLFTPLAQIPPQVIAATEWQEDRYYRFHPGINPVAAARSAWRFCLGGGRARGGASTLSMQLARLRFRLRTRTLRGKLVQMLRAVELERHYTKEQLLEAYFNLAPYGRNVEGIGAASQLYLGKEPLALTQPEAVALCVIPQSPARRAPWVGRENPALTLAQNRLYDRLLAARPDLDAMGKEFRLRAAASRPFLAPHFTTGVLKTNISPDRTRSRIITTLDLDLQRLLEGRMDRYLATNASRRFSNAAAMLVDTRSMEVLAQIGSANFLDQQIQGQVDGTQRPRSPGSALKPFIYALAMDQGLIHPLSMVVDAPHRFGDYNPENFDREFTGPLTATEALSRSRNVPAVALAARLSHPTLYEFLQSAGVRLPREAGFYGLALPLGGGEVTMESLVRMYAALANGGRLRELRRLATDADTPEPAPPRLLSPEACYLTLEMLGHVPPPGFSQPDANFPIFWKTGTSHGFRDAWSVAVFDHYVLAVWIGRFDGRGNPEFVGRTAAAPLLFGMIDALRAAGVARSSRHDPPEGANLRRVQFCAVSGDLPGAVCRHRVEGWFIPGISPIGECRVHREILLDDATGLRVAVDDGTRALHRETYEFWPTELRNLFRQAGLTRREPPPFLPPAAGGTDTPVNSVPTGRLRILSPRVDVAYQLRADGPDRRAPLLQAQTESGTARVYWFAGKDFLGSCRAGDPFPWPSARPGSWRLTALDDQGRSDACTVRLEVAP